ncbi:DNA methyltransferase [Candidatus Chrysopegis kryptomonas]|jgi:DNA modification methylase|uniref:site-specific DNA-methyltransferase (cytosine-N(4)-specific) n=1 Tax=Candidatus Chryseopegocella kryptomonas TaxID=1633643 RepID=A0A0P1MNX1_9BACT|nr:DNA methyltransferase [Candidatus Chrysopegis kryptomonas]CUS97257.1 DNA methylase [Candidatus Chrysopegis kryptomonas]
MRAEFLSDIEQERSKFDEFGRVRDERFDFKNVPASSGIYAIHPYPAMFHFLVVRHLISEFSKEGDLVFDPFVGSGVSAGESLISGRNFWGCDINPLSILISKVRTTPLSYDSLLSALQKIINTRIKNFDFVNFKNIDYWFDDYVIYELSKLRKIIFDIEDEKLRRFFLVSFSETVRKVSKADPSEFKLLRRKKRVSKNVFSVFKEISLKNIWNLTEFYRRNPPKNSKIVLEEANVLDELPVEDVDLVITSPPYGDSRTTVAYGQFSRLSLQWLGIDEKVDKTSLGAKPREISCDLPSEILYTYLEKLRSEDRKRAEEVFSFYFDLFSAVRNISGKVRFGGIVCFVVGNRRVKGVELPTDKIATDFFKFFGFKHIKTVVREISNKRMPSQNSPKNIRGQKDFTMKYEYIVILRKDLK